MGSSSYSLRLTFELLKTAILVSHNTYMTSERTRYFVEDYDRTIQNKFNFRYLLSFILYVKYETTELAKNQLLKC